MRELLKEKGYFVITTQTSMYLVDADQKRAKRMPHSFSLSEKFDISEQRRDGEWFEIMEAKAAVGVPMLLVATGISESSDVITVRHTTPVFAISHTA